MLFQISIFNLFAAEKSNYMSLGSAINNDQELRIDFMYNISLSRDLEQPTFGIGVEVINQFNTFLIQMILLSPPEFIGIKFTYMSPIKNNILSFTDHLSLHYITDDGEHFNEYREDGFDMLVSIGHQINFCSNNNINYYVGLDLDTYIDFQADLNSAELPLVLARFLIGANFTPFSN